MGPVGNQKRSQADAACASVPVRSELSDIPASHGSAVIQTPLTIAVQQHTGRYELIVTRSSDSARPILKVQAVLARAAFTHRFCARDAIKPA